MAKTDKSQKTTKKPSRAGKIIGSILLCLFTFIFSLLALISGFLNLSTHNNNFSRAVSYLDIAQEEVTQNGESKTLDSWIYTWYMEGAPNLTEEYAKVALNRPEVRSFLTDYCDELCLYLSRKSDEMPLLNIEAFCDILQNDLGDTLANETGVRFENGDRDYLIWSTDEDIPAWNDTLYSLAGHGFGKVVTRFFCTTAGLITAAILLVACFILWLILALCKHWHTGHVLVAYAVGEGAIPLIATVGGGFMLLLVDAMKVISSLQFARESLPILLLPLIWSALVLAVYGIIIFIIGISVNAARKKNSSPEEAPIVKEKKPKEKKEKKPKKEKKDKEKKENIPVNTPVEPPITPDVTPDIPDVSPNIDSEPITPESPAETPISPDNTPDETVTPETSSPEIQSEDIPTDDTPIEDTPVSDTPENTENNDENGVTCPNCGKLNPPESLFCGGCGGKLS